MFRRAQNLGSAPTTARDHPRRLLASHLATGGVAQLVERLTGSQEVRGFESHRLHPFSPGDSLATIGRRLSRGSHVNGLSTQAPRVATLKELFSREIGGGLGLDHEATAKMEKGAELTFVEKITLGHHSGVNYLSIFSLRGPSTER
jgi:hypothetical protein